MFQVKRDSDTQIDQVGLDANDFTMEYGFNVWVHYTVTYRYNGYNNNMQVYFNGEIPKNAWKYVGSWHETNDLDYDGHLEVGVIHLGNPYWGTGDMMIHDLIVWEEQLPCDDVYRLYQAYNM